ncbi:MAG: MFS transporter [Halothiobacillus sp. 14-56-357]|jgi:MFS family permease|uniref:MFS transporter n=1 Tax=Halothiobacillus sp. 15-55-196 TaxID=1970382 RepID=UPI000BC3678E|nr:MFS transporter [Halothiobacillus sp. 15-55-196]OZB36704.1 MAG: MFS transporter [Halothiobacillus sp. 15-55-196]OZB57388.1 MAG: MFS transporter [Halothiobacillus sp. 14-56-357]OZB79487.1 MAG: MFS transporter [Halothiobacillus sp. 13-55-115]
MFSTVITMQSLLLGMAILLAGSGMLSTLLGLRAQQDGMSTVVLGVVMSGFYLGYILGTYLLPSLIRRVGHVRVFAAMAALSASAALLHGLWLNEWLWLTLRVISGFALLGLYMVIESWLNAQISHYRGQIFGIYMMVSLLALAVGQFLIGIYGVNGLASFMVVALLFALGLVPVALTRATQPAPVEAARLSVRAIYENAPTGLIGSLLSGTATGALWGLAAVYGAHIGLDAARAALFVALLIFGGALLQWPIGKLSDHYDRRWVLIGLGLAGILSGGVMIAITMISAPGDIADSPLRWMLWIGGLLFGGFVFSVYAISVAQTHDRLSSDQVLEATRTLLLVNGIGALFGPLSAGVFMGWFGANGLIGFIMLVLSVLGLFTYWRIRIDRPVPEDERGEFVVTTRTSAAAADWDPRTPEAGDSLSEQFADELLTTKNG